MLNLFHPSQAAGRTMLKPVTSQQG